MVEVTGAKGKTTTAHALASLMKGRGVLHTSMGTFRYPERSLLWRSSITPASLISAARAAWEMKGWLIAEVSLGVSGIGDMAILTSIDDYPIAGGARRAIDAKLGTLAEASQVVMPSEHEGAPEYAIGVEAVTKVEGSTCFFAWGGREGAYTNPLLLLEGYRLPLRLATTAACLLGIDPSPLGHFQALEGRMSLRREGDILIVDNSNSGTCRETTLEAVEYARTLTGNQAVTLVIGEEARAICEGFAAEEIARTIAYVRPGQVILVGHMMGLPGYEQVATLDEGLKRARAVATGGSIVLAVKTWR
jgi:hypothetical protein